MERGFSDYLNLMRLLASLTIFLYHANSLVMPRPIHLSHDLGHSTVALFFVLSGYVIAYVAAERERSLSEFIASRAARVYSVALPVLLLTMAIDTVIFHSAMPVPLPRYQYAAVWKYLPIFLSFTGDFWFLTERTFSNVPYWSLGYEVWYYVFFAIVFYGRGLWRWALGAFVLVAFGPKLWALLPIWFMGVSVYWLQRRWSLPARTARLLLMATIACLASLTVTNLIPSIDEWGNAISGGWFSAHLNFSQWFLSDWLIGLICCANIFFARFAALRFGHAAPTISLLAGWSFTLYLAHFPLLEFYFWIAGLNGVPACIAVLMTTALLGAAIEHKKTSWRRFFLHCWHQTGRFGAAPTVSYVNNQNN